MDVNENNWVVYMHITPNGKKYVGITGNDVERRWRNGNGYKTNLIFTRAINKYGWDNIEHKIIAEKLSFEDACNLEIKLIAELKLLNKKYGYNLTAGGEGTPGHTVPEETRKKLSEMFSGMNNPNFGRTGELHPLYGLTKGESHSAKKVICLNTMESFDSIIEAGESMNCTIEHISNCCQGTRKTCGTHPITGEKLVWAFLEKASEMNEDEIRAYIAYRIKRTPHSEETRRKIGDAHRGRKLSDEQKKKISELNKGKKMPDELRKKLSKAVICLNTLEVFDSIMDAAKKYDIEYSGISKCCLGKSEYSGKDALSGEKLAWKYYDEYLKLKELGFVWAPKDDEWEINYKELVAFMMEYGSCLVSRRVNETLANWVFKQRQNYKKNNLSIERIEKLNAIGFIWDPYKGQWESMYNLLVHFKKENGHCNIPLRYIKNEQLGKWVNTQRQNYKNKQLTEDQIQKLNNIGFSWDPINDAWNTMFNLLKLFKEMNGHCRVPDKYKENPQLGLWVGNQRRNYKKKKLTVEQIQKLNNIGFVWYPKEMPETKAVICLNTLEVFDSIMNAAKKYDIGYSGISKCCLGKCEYSGKNALSGEKLTWKYYDEYLQLKESGFVWVPKDDEWEIMYKELVTFKMEYGNCLVSRRVNKTLANWVFDQRKNYKKNNLSTERIEKFNAIGFIWDLHKENWESMYNLLVDFKKENGHYNVPLRYIKNKQLGEWVLSQRKHYKNKKLTEEQIQKLNNIGFVWYPKEKNKQENASI
ncbi:Helicase associated domain protein [Neobacillus pocheonensis]|uniref:Helicase associated domain protein n=1 Tax=Neobacillus pocheonensis TaxID=363869 RepID=A0ABT0WHV4_9BACI|nr:Helicase associated domain protein [Neobacillus pocheonensis]